MARTLRRDVQRYGSPSYLAVGALALSGYLFVHGLRIGALFNVIALSGAVVIIVGMLLNRPTQWLPWVMFGLGQVLFVTGDVITYNYEKFFHEPLPFPSWGDPFYLSVYPCLIAGLMLLTRRRSQGGDRESAIDSLIVAIGVGAVSWVFLMAPIARAEDLTGLQKLISIAYPLMDLMVLTAAIRLAVGTGRRPVAFYLMATSIIALFVTDSIYAWISVHNIVYNNATGYLEGGWGLFYLLWGAAALHPSMSVLDEPTEAREPRRPRRRLYILAGASLMAPGVELAQALRGNAVDVPVLAACSAALFLLVLGRLNGLMVDITEHRKTERQLRDAETKYRTLVEGLPAVVYVAEFGEEGRWTYVSPQIESFLGFSQREFMSAGKLWRERIVPEDRDLALQAEIQLLEGRERMQCEYRIRGRDGDVLWIREEAAALLNERGRPAYLQGVMYDVTKQKDSERRLRDALETEKEAATRLRAVHAMQNSFLEAVSHDLRTPLTSIMGNAITLEHNSAALSPEDRMDLIHRVSTNARKLHRLLTNLLDLDRMARGVLEPNRDHVDVSHIAEAVIDELRVETHPVVLLSSEPVIANVDGAQVERIIENLITNAVRYTPAGTGIWVSAEVWEEGVLIVVDDEGPGVREDLRGTIFEPFRQGDEVVPHAPGVGVGLSLVARFAQLHGGRAWVQERPGGGASFRVYLPNHGDGVNRSQRQRGDGAADHPRPHASVDRPKPERANGVSPSQTERTAGAGYQ